MDAFINFQVIFSLVVLFSIFFTSCNSDEFEGYSSYTLEHSLETDGNEVFVKRGTITIRSIKGGNAHFSQEAPLNSEQRLKLRALVETKSVYRVRIPYKTQNNPDVTQYVYTFTEACAIYESGLSELITLNVDTNGVILGLSLSPVIPYCKGEAVMDSDITNFNTTIEVVQTVTGPSPDTQQYIQKMEAEKKQKEEGGQQDNRSFLAKYWMYIVPLVILMMLMSNADQNAGGGGGR